jgi:hypothetical protein
MPATVTDPTTGRALHVRRATYPASAAGRMAISPTYPADSVTGRTTFPRTVHPVATVAGDTPPATLARRLRRYMDESAESYAEAASAASAADLSARQRGETVAALVAAGWRAPYRPDKEPTAPDLPAGTYVFSERVEDDRVSLDIRRMTAAQAIAVLEILRAPAL